MTPPSAGPTTGRGLRYMLLGAGVVVLAVVLVFLVLPPLRRSSDLSSLTDAADATFKRLVEAKDAGLDAKLEDRMNDGSAEFKNRVGAAKVLLKREQQRRVEGALRSPDLLTRGVALAALERESYFRKQYVDDPSYRVKETLVEWIGRDGEPNRRHALRIAMTLRLTEALPAIRALVADPPAGAQPSKEASDLRRRAIDALQFYTDCESVLPLQRIATSDPDPETRMSAMGVLLLMSRARGTPCAQTLTPGMVREVLHAALETPGDTPGHRALRRRATTEMRRNPVYAEGKLDVLRARLAPGVDAGERRDALETLAALEDAPTLDALPRHVHDPEPQLRAGVVVAVNGIRAPERFGAMAPLLVGYLRDEPGDSSSAAVFEAGLNRLRQDAGAWIGFPEKRRNVGPNATPELRTFMKNLYADGEAEGVTRASLSEAWFRHYAGKAGLDVAGVEAAVQARNAFQAKARANDVAGAKAVLDGVSRPELFAYERGWLEAKAR